MKMQVLNSLDSFSITHDIPQCGLLKRPLIFGGVVKLRSMDERNAGFGCGFRKFKAINCRASAASGAINSTSGAVEATSSDVGMKDGNLVFVAGATGRVGSRTVRELLKLGFRVRAGVRSAQRAESLVQSVQQMKLDGAASSLTPPIERLEIVECDLEKNEGIRGGLGNASIVICSIGASEKEVFDVTGPCRIDYRATKNLIDTASVAKVDHFILVTSLGTNKFGFPAAILNLFWGVLIWKRKAEEALLASGLPYTIVRPGGMERPTDAYKETHNITLSVEDTLFGGQVSNLQVAELMAFMAKNRSLSYCKVVEVIAETTAPLTPMEELLAKIPSQRDDGNVSKVLGNVERPGTAIPERSPPETPSISVESKSTQTKAAAPTPLSPYTAYEDLKPPTSPSPTPSTGAKFAANSSAVAVNSIIELPSIPTESEGKKASPLSPYINYEDLKPPTSPCPSPPSIGAKLAANSSPVAVNSIELPSIPTESEGKKANALSPYMNYEDLKPPTSPCPSPPSIGAKLAANPSPVAVNSIELPSITTKSEVKKESPLSPYINYDDLKPPTSPTPNPPSGGSTIAAINVATKPEPAAAVKLETKTALSPYTAYEDLKPPTSPIPTPSGPRE